MARPRASKWSQEVTNKSNALDLKEGVFSQKSPKRIAASLKDSAEHSERRKADPFRSAMSMLTFYINRAGAQLPVEDREKLEKTKEELRELYHRPTVGRNTALGKRAEKAQDPAAGGPSGQKDKAKHDRKHANK